MLCYTPYEGSKYATQVGQKLEVFDRKSVTHILINIRENELLILNSDFLHCFNQLGIRIMSHNIQIAN